MKRRVLKVPVSKEVYSCVEIETEIDIYELWEAMDKEQKEQFITDKRSDVFDITLGDSNFVRDFCYMMDIETAEEFLKYIEFYKGKGLEDAKGK